VLCRRIASRSLKPSPYLNVSIARKYRLNLGLNLIPSRQSCSHISLPHACSLTTVLPTVLQRKQSKYWWPGDVLNRDCQPFLKVRFTVLRRKLAALQRKTERTSTYRRPYFNVTISLLTCYFLYSYKLPQVFIGLFYRNITQLVTAT